ncbi:MAG: hypothetical protein ACKD6N_01870 [Candidatus Bathyarchaeota archaeon]
MLVRYKVKIKVKKLKPLIKLRNFLREKTALKPVPGYSMSKIMVSGLILPIITSIFLLFSINLSSILDLPPLTMFLFMCLCTFSGFFLAIVILTKLTGKILNWAREEK